MTTPVTAALVKELRDRTGAGMSDCKKALEATAGDLDKAAEKLRMDGAAKADKKAGRTAAEGVIALAAGSDAVALVEINSETDFVAKGEDFRRLAHDLALHIAAASPRWVSAEDVPPEVLEQERELYRRQAEQEGRPPAVIDRIVENKVARFYEEHCLLEQPFVRDPAVRVKELIAQTAAKVQEHIAVRRFSRFSIREA